ncbi:hypothetical protein CISG_05131 [Coccidioides immitis RMSCC 3703]|uniref:Uncharacterized protein n=1 Tax=Coccidioides immitis RMSCC 3703 TaxID=454286 RepID=A0A0J8QVZ5_COCIT|nr:hypothetical protein CISG_05131 [Coccidioides immitis RMSCC 3703]
MPPAPLTPDPPKSDHSNGLDPMKPAFGISQFWTRFVRWFESHKIVGWKRNGVDQIERGLLFYETKTFPGPLNTSDAEACEPWLLAFSFWASTKESLGKFKLVRAVRHKIPFLDADGGKTEFM